MNPFERQRAAEHNSQMLTGRLNTCPVHKLHLEPRFDNLTNDYINFRGESVKTTFTNIPLFACPHPGCESARISPKTRDVMVRTLKSFNKEGLEIDLIPYPLEFNSNQ